MNTIDIIGERKCTHVLDKYPSRLSIPKRLIAMLSIDKLEYC